MTELAISDGGYLPPNTFTLRYFMEEDKIEVEDESNGNRIRLSYTELRDCMDKAAKLRKKYGIS